jgi:arsenate reductase-like glutaredoxin family protein
MQYNIIDIVDNKITDAKLKEIINKKLYKIIEFMEFNVNTAK